MKSLLFPEEVESQLINHEKAEKTFLAPNHFNFTVHPNPLFRNNKLIMKSELENYGGKFILIVNPLGGAFPYGGTNPFGISFSRSFQDTVKYVGPRFPPEPPSPMEIMIHEKSKIIFFSDIPLGLYEWQGKPEVSFDWAFYFYKEPYLRGTLKVILPMK